MAYLRGSTIFSKMGLIKEQMEKDHESEENMVKMMTQLDLFSKHIMGGGLKVLNVVGTSIEQCPEDAIFEALYNENTQYF